VEIKTRKSFNDLITSLTEEILDEEELDEITTTGDIEGYSTPFAFTGKSKKSKKKKKKISTNSTGYKVVKEALDDKDLKQIRKVIKDVVGDIFRDIWLKRNSWKKAS
tara:strand:+ start:192 stop:512 length:321 start_codon:yes stop_codon:yes gene_type:complete